MQKKTFATVAYYMKRFDTKYLRINTATTSYKEITHNSQYGNFKMMQKKFGVKC